jgi:rhodanese-related sulfurtransferase
MHRAVLEVSIADVPAPLPPEVLVLDVREPYEWSAGHIAEAVHVPLMQIPQRLEDIPSSQPILVVCKVGGRSAQAAEFLQANGRDAVSLVGGMISWNRSGRPMVADGDAAPQVA